MAYKDRFPGKLAAYWCRVLNSEQNVTIHNSRFDTIHTEQTFISASMWRENALKNLLNSVSLIDSDSIGLSLKFYALQ